MSNKQEILELIATIRAPFAAHVADLSAEPPLVLPFGDVWEIDGALELLLGLVAYEIQEPAKQELAATLSDFLDRHPDATCDQLNKVEMEFRRAH